MDFDTYDDLKSKLPLSNVGLPALAGIAFILVMVAVLAAGRLIGTATANEFNLQRSPEAASSQPQDAAAEEHAQPVYVHVSGAVVNPGLYELPEGSRVYDAVQAAGGFGDDAAADSVNLARVLTDGEQVLIAAMGAPDEGDSTEAASSPASTGVSTRVNINLASAAELQTLPGIGESTASKIVADREANGTFKTVEDLKRVSGIGDRKLEALADLICV